MTVDELLQAVANCGYNVSLDGPDVTKIAPAYRWTLRCYTNERDAYTHPVGRKMFHGESPADVLTQALTWIENREQP